MSMVIISAPPVMLLLGWRVNLWDVSLWCRPSVGESRKNTFGNSDRLPMLLSKP